MRGFFHMANLNQFYRTAAPIFLLLGIGTIVDQYIPGLTRPGDPMTWAAFAIACALVAK